MNVNEVNDEDTVVLGCGQPAVFKLTGPLDAVYTVLVAPKHGALHLDVKKHTVTWVPNNGYCHVGGNDGFVLRWVDSKGNSGTMLKMITIVRQGDVPNMIRTGQ